MERNDTHDQPAQPDEDHSAREQLEQLGLAAAKALDDFLRSVDDEMQTAVEDAARSILAGLEAGGLAAVDAARAALAVAPTGEPNFWRSPLGKLIAQHVGYGQETVPRVQAAAIIGVTRQRISQMEREGVLERVPGGVSNSSVLQRLKGGPPRG